jgi:hypothetical protein
MGWILAQVRVWGLGVGQFPSLRHSPCFVVDCYHAIQVGLPAIEGQLGATYAIPIIYVLVLMITHIAEFYLLLRPSAQGGWAARQRSGRIFVAGSRGLMRRDGTPTPLVEPRAA